MKTEAEIRAIVESIWNKESENLTTNDEGVLSIYIGWSTPNEDDNDRYMVESYGLGGSVPFYTGREGMKDLLEAGFVPLKVFLNGSPIDVDDFLTQFKQRTHE